MSDERTQHGDQPPGPAEPTGPSEPAEPTATSGPMASADPSQPAPPPAWPAPPDHGQPPPQWPAPPPVEPQPGPGAVHPLDVGRAFSVGWSLFRFRWRALLGAAFLVMVPAYAVQALLSIWAAGAFERWGLAVQEAWLEAINAGRQPQFADLPGLPLEGLIASFAGGIIVGLAGVLVAAALIYIIGWTYGGARPGVGRALGQAFSRLPSLIGATLLLALLIFLVILGGALLSAALILATGFQAGPLALLVFIIIVTTIVAVIFLTLRWTFYVQAIMLEGAGAIASLGRSWRLVSGSTWRVLGYLLLLLLVMFLVGIVAGVVTVLLFGLGVDMQTGQPLPMTPAQAAGQSLVPALGSLLVTPFFMAVMTLLYFDLRWRAREEIGAPPA